MLRKSQNKQRSEAPATTKKPKLRLGSHLSVAGGLTNAIDEGVRLGCDCLQIFVKNQRQWRAKPLQDNRIEVFRETHKQSGLSPIIAHASYLINLASSDESTRERSIDALTDEFDRCDRLGIAYLVVHPGAAMDAGEDQAIDNIIQSLNAIDSQRISEPSRCASRLVSGSSEPRVSASDQTEPRPSGSGLKGAAGFSPRGRKKVEGQSDSLAESDCLTVILLETTAGQGSSIGHRFEQLAAVRKGIKNPEHIGICLDTCHLFAAGYDFRTEETYNEMIADLDSAIGLSQVKCIHMNDSKRELGSRVDRHEHIGKGEIGLSGFANFVNDPHMAGLPMILETPKGTDGRGANFDTINLKRLRSLSE